MRPLTLGLLRDVAQTGDPTRLARWSLWVPSRPRALRRICMTMVMHDFGVLLSLASPDPTEEPDDTPAPADEGWTGLLNSVYYLGMDLAWFFKWSPKDVWKCSLAEAFLFSRDGGWREATDAAQRASAAGGDVDRLPPRPAPVPPPPSLVSPAMMRAMDAAANAAEDKRNGR